MFELTFGYFPLQHNDAYVQSLPQMCMWDLDLKVNDKLFYFFNLQLIKWKSLSTYISGEHHMPWASHYQEGTYWKEFEKNNSDLPG